MEASGWLLPKLDLGMKSAELSDTVLRELADLGYVDEGDGIEPTAEPQFVEGAVPWWQEPPRGEG
ncbi:MAG: hypothetical protein H8E31_15395 [Planctomycetes bacterium]|nr:hypothetical protein [Planctomycetota bacterium]